MDIVRVTTCGSVDDGKSTLIGRLLQDSGQVYDDHLQEAHRAGASAGQAASGLAYLTDGLRSEREQGITIDVAYRYMTVDGRRLILADCPGHIQYTRNMITGLSLADCAILLLDAQRGVREQTRRHLMIAALMRTGSLIVAVNKMDAIAWDEAAFGGLESELRAAATAFGISSLTLIPISALRGANVLKRATEAPWYRGPTIAEALGRVAPSHRAPGAATVAPLQGVLKVGGARRYLTRIASGRLTRGMRVKTFPGGQDAVVGAIYNGFNEVTEAVAEQSIAFTIDGDLDLDRGDMVLGELPAALARKQLIATLFWLDAEALDPNRSYLFRHLTAELTCRIDRVDGGLDLETGAISPAPARIGSNAIVKASLRLSRPLPLSAYAETSALGRFVLIDPITKATVAAGLVDG